MTLINKSGIVNVYKEEGYTSRDVVNIIRKFLGIKRIGHSGTLDPNVSGVLPICFGKATRLADYIQDHGKVYKGRIRLGISTDTLDITGKIISESVREPSYEEIIEKSHNYIGEVNQVPPMYSAVHHNGVRLYELARQGQSVERKVRRVSIHSFNLFNYNYPYIDFECSCSKGTYIRTLVDDLCSDLKISGCLDSMTRARSGPFAVENAYKISEIEAKIEKGDYSFITRMEDSIPEFPDIVLNDKYIDDIINGKSIRLEQIVDEAVEYRVFCGYNFMGLGKVSDKLLTVNKMLFER